MFCITGSVLESPGNLTLRFLTKKQYCVANGEFCSIYLIHYGRLLSFAFIWGFLLLIATCVWFESLLRKMVFTINLWGSCKILEFSGSITMGTLKNQVHELDHSSMLLRYLCICWQSISSVSMIKLTLLSLVKHARLSWRTVAW